MVGRAPLASLLRRAHAQRYELATKRGVGDALGRNLRLDRTSVAIVGVAPRGFEGEFAGNPPDFWLPLGAQPAVSGPGRSSLRTRNTSWLNVMARLRPGVTAAQAQAGMQPLLESLRADLRVDAQNGELVFEKARAREPAAV